MQLGDLVQLVRGRLSRMQRAVLSALIVIEVHAKDVSAKLVDEGVCSVNDFEWISQLRLNRRPSPDPTAPRLLLGLCILVKGTAHAQLDWCTVFKPVPGITGPEMTCISEL